MICEQQPERIVNSQLWHHMQWQPAGEQFNSNKIAAPTPGLPPPSVAASGKCKYVKMRTQRAFRASRKLTRRLHEVKIDYVGINNFTQFSYDGLWRNTKIVETTSGSVTSTKLMCWTSNDIRPVEERDATGIISKLFYVSGQTISGTNYYFARNHLGSVTEMTNESGLPQSQYVYDSFGRVVKLQGSLDGDAQYCGYYVHQRSGMNLTLMRAYSAQMGRWINRDPIEESGGENLYAYVESNPLSNLDPSGLGCVEDCFSHFFGLGAIGASAIAAGQPTITKPFSPGAATTGTSLASTLFGNLGKTDMSIPSPTGFPPTMRGTPFLGRAFARYLPYIGTGVTILSIKELIDCLNNCPPPPEQTGDFYPPPYDPPPPPPSPPPLPPPNNPTKPPKCKIWSRPGWGTGGTKLA
ncbi:MAG: RHS repeat-associated core domain-containing protein [Candidatus Melainabacteria bacterium]|nr:RHS repeat-associated core domain-containing protein [Candidatus Melainabacteria bacterium]